MKCNRCNLEKPAESFSWKIKAKGLRQLSCKPCAAAFQRAYRNAHREKTLETNRRAYDKNREKYLAQKKDHYRRNMEAYKARGRAKYLKVKDSPEFKKKTRERELKAKFGLTLAGYNVMSEKQGHVCLICGRGGRMVVDHCHVTGRVRGLLCCPCNSFLGRINDDVKKLEKIKQYLLGQDEAS